MQGKNPTIWCIACSIAAFLLSIAFFHLKGMLDFPSVVSSLAVGFFLGSMAFSLLSIHEHATRSISKAMGSTLALSFFVGAIAGAFFLYSSSAAKALEIMLIVSGLSSLLIGAHFEKAHA